MKGLRDLIEMTKQTNSSQLNITPIIHHRTVLKNQKVASDTMLNSTLTVRAKSVKNQKVASDAMLNSTLTVRTKSVSGIVIPIARACDFERRSYNMVSYVISLTIHSR